MPVIVVYAMAVWFVCGIGSNNWWWQLICYGIATYLMVELNNTNALIRIFSRMVSCAFLALTCCACFLFPALPEAVMLVCLVASALLLFQTYQDKTAAGFTYYAFLFYSIASIAYVHVLFFLPIIWLLMITNIMSMSWRTWAASIIGLLTPYWFGSIWLIYQHEYTLIADHFSALMVFEEPFNLYGITMFYGFFMWMDLAAFVFLWLQPQHFNAMLLIMILNTSPLIAHFIALTSTRLTNIVFLLLSAATIVLTFYNIWSSSSLY